jgi:hypothetical protein
MKIFFEVIFLILLLAVLGIFYSLHFAPPQNLVNQTLRPVILTHPFVRKLLNLNSIGDNRYAYLHNPQALQITVWHEPQYVPDPKVNDWLKTIIAQTLNRPAAITYQILTQPLGPSQTDADLKAVLKLIHPIGDLAAPSLSLVYVPESQSAPTNAGAVLTSDTIFLFTHTIANLSDRENIRQRIEQSTIMHEWGHLLGLEHLNETGCIMSEKVEVYPNRQFQGSNIPTAYCAEELYQLKK